MSVAQSTTSSQKPATSTKAPHSEAHLFLKEGEYWTITYEGVVIRLRDAKGMQCLALLLSQPGIPLSAVDLVAAADDSHRAAACSAEQARVTVTKRIKMSVAKIQEHHPSLGHHLLTCIKTGAHCLYSPNPERPVRWRF